MKRIIGFLLLLVFFSCKDEELSPDNELLCEVTEYQNDCDPSKPLTSPENYQLNTIGHITQNSQVDFPVLQKFQFVSEQKGFAYSNDIYSSVSEFFKTTDEGSNWDLVEIDSLESIGNFQFRDESFGILVGNRNEIFITENGGLDWQLTSLIEDSENVAAVTAIVYDDLKNIYISVLRIEFENNFKTSISILKSIDNGASWETIFTPGSVGLFTSVSVQSDMLIIEHGFSISKVSLDGDLISETELDNPTDDFYVINENEWVRLSQFGGLYVTQDAGLNWTKISGYRSSSGIAGLSGGRIIGFESIDKGLYIGEVGTCPYEDHAVEECAIFFIDNAEGICQYSDSAYNINGRMSNSQKMGANKWYMAVDGYLIALEED